MIDQSKESDESVSVILIDIDNFKRINDSYGHKVGDAVLVSVADILTVAMREANGIVARIGGEEFVVLVIHKEIAGVIVLADQIRLDIKNAAIEAQSTFISATASIGLAHHVAGNDLDDTLLCADKALYLAKNAGRDRVMGLKADMRSSCSN